LGVLARLRAENGLQSAEPNWQPRRETWFKEVLKFKAKNGDNEEEERNNIIGSEGAGLTSDEVVVITTDWYEEKIFPENLENEEGAAPQPLLDELFFFYVIHPLVNSRQQHFAQKVQITIITF